MTGSAPSGNPKPEARATSETGPGAPQPRPRWKRLLQNLGLSCGTFLLCAVVFEIVLRLNGYGSLEIYVPDPALYWRLKPNQDCFTKIDHKPVHINSQGTRGPEFATAKPPGTFRILSLGDSRTFGWGLTEAETYSARLETLLQQQVGPARKVEVINAGVNAWSYPQMLVYFRDFALRYQPDVVLVGEANFWTQFSEKNSPEFVRQFMRRVWLKNLLRRSAIFHYIVEVKLRDFYERHRMKFIPVDPRQDPLFKAQQQKDPEEVFRAAIHDLCAAALTNRVQPLLIYLPRLDELDPTNPPMNLVAKRAVSRELNVPFEDMTSSLPTDPKPLYLEADPVHLSPRGNEIVAQRLLKIIAPLAAR